MTTLVHIALTLDVDPVAWARVRGVAVGDVKGDVQAWAHDHIYEQLDDMGVRAKG